MPVQTDIFCLAPLRGVTDRAFRVVFSRHFGGFDHALAPFIPTVSGERIKPSLLAEWRPEANIGMPMIPQILGKDPGQLSAMLAAIRAMGHTRADLNVGCPWPMVVRRGRGSGLMRRAENLARMLDAGCAGMPGGFSIKVRLGIETPDLLLERLEIINAFPLREVAIHPRTARQMYDGHVNLARFSECLARCRHPVVYNGDIRSARDLQRLRKAFPQVSRWMIGRGAVGDPFLGEVLRGTTRERDMPRLKAFLDDLLAVSEAEMRGDRQILGRFKELWGYLGPGLREGRTLLRRIQLSGTVDDYRHIVEDGFSRNPAWGPERDGLPDTLFE